MSTLKELTMGKDVKWIGSANGRCKKLTREERFSADDVKGEYDPDDWVSLTVPGQSKSIKELMDRYEKGRPSPVQ